MDRKTRFPLLQLAARPSNRPSTANPNTVSLSMVKFSMACPNTVSPSMASIRLLPQANRLSINRTASPTLTVRPLPVATEAMTSTANINNPLPHLPPVATNTFLLLPLVADTIPRIAELPVASLSTVANNTTRDLLRFHMEAILSKASSMGHLTELFV